MKIEFFEEHCLEIRKSIIEMLSFSKRGHVGSAFSIVEILVSLYFEVMNHDPKNSNSQNRDRFILSKGHGCMALYATLARAGYFDSEILKTFCRYNSKLGGHPKRGDVLGVEASTGSLGQGISIAVGMALFLKRKKLNDPKVFVLLGDGECNEGSVWEAALSASKNNLSNLVVLVDYNKFQSYDEVKNVCDLEPFDEKWKSFGFDVIVLDMIRRPLDLINYLKTPNHSKKPVAIICNTVKGLGNIVCESNLEWHHKNSVSEVEIKELYKGLIKYETSRA